MQKPRQSSGLWLNFPGPRGLHSATASCKSERQGPFLGRGCSRVLFKAACVKRSDRQGTPRPVVLASKTHSSRISSQARALAPKKIFGRDLKSLLSGLQLISGRQRGVLLLNVLVLICGLNWVVLKQSESVLDPGLFCILRFGIAALAFWPYFKQVDGKIYTAGIEIGFWAAVGYLAQAQGLLTTDASHASFISTLTVLVVPILAGLSGKGVKIITWASAVLAFCGVGLLEDGFSMPCTGDMWQLLSAFAFGVQIFRTEHHSTSLKEGSALPLMSVVVATIAAASIVLTASEHISETLTWLAHPGQLLQSLSMPTWQQTLPVVWSALMSTDLVLLIEVLALHDVSSTDASIIYTAEPVLGAGFAYLLLGERWGPLGWAGAALIIASSLVTQLHSLQPEQESQDS